MRISAEFDDEETAMVAAKKLTDEGEIAADDIEFRSAWPMFEEALPPSLQRPMRIRNFVRFLWVIGAISGFSMVWYCQMDYQIHTSGHPLVPVPIDAIITYECAQITGLIMTTFFFFIETNQFRMRPIPFEEDLAVANGQVAVVVGGPRAEAAKTILERGGARLVRTFTTIMFTLLLGAIMAFGTGCSSTSSPNVRMRIQTGQGLDGYPIKDQENVNAGFVPGIYSMPWTKDPDIVKMTEPYGRLLEWDVLKQMQTEHPARTGTPPEVKNFKNPVANTVQNEERGQQIYTENCIFCHGVAGHGDGPVAGVYSVPPADLSGTTRKDLLPPALAPKDLGGQTDGDLYWTITVAPVSQTMPPFATKLSAMDRFYVVRYIRKLQRDAGAPLPKAKNLKVMPKSTAGGPAATSSPAASSSPEAGSSPGTESSPSTETSPSAESSPATSSSESSPAAVPASGEPSSAASPDTGAAPGESPSQ